MCVAGVFWYRQQKRHKLKGYVDHYLDSRGHVHIDGGGASHSHSHSYSERQTAEVRIDVNMAPHTDDIELGTNTNTALDSLDVESDAQLMRYDALPDRDQQHPAHQRALSNLPALPATNEVDIVKYLDAVALAEPAFGAHGGYGYMNGEPQNAMSEPTETGTDMTDTQTQTQTQTNTRHHESKDEYEVYGAVQRHDDDDDDDDEEDSDDGDSEEMYLNNASHTTSGYQAVQNPAAARSSQQEEGSGEEDEDDDVDASRDHLNEDETDFETNTDSHSRQT